MEGLKECQVKLQSLYGDEKVWKLKDIKDLFLGDKGKISFNWMRVEEPEIAPTEIKVIKIKNQINFE